MVRVLIERRVSEGMVESFYQTLREMRREAIHTPGYISGESLRNARDHHHFAVLSTWNSIQAWEAWSRSEARHEVMLRIAPMLEESERITVFEPL